MADDLAALDIALAALQQTLGGPSMQACTRAAAAVLLPEAQRRVHVLSGQVRDNLGLVSTHGAHTAATAVQVADSAPGGGAHEAVFLEFGTSRMPAFPFMRPAFDAGQAAALTAFQASLQSLLQPHT